MEAPDDSALLAAWEYGRPLPPLERALALLAAAGPGLTWEELARLPIGRRDALLLELRRRLFGPRCACVARCAACGERLEFDLLLDELRAPPPPEGGLPTAAIDGAPLAFRPPSSLDLAAIRLAPDRAAARRQLLARCVEGGADIAPGALGRVAELMAAADPQADVEIMLDCPACGHGAPAPFEIGAYLWSEVDAWAARTLREVHLLARAYGWREGDVLALSPRRRRAYLELLADE